MNDPRDHKPNCRSLASCLVYHPKGEVCEGYPCDCRHQPSVCGVCLGDDMCRNPKPCPLHPQQVKGVCDHSRNYRVKGTEYCCQDCHTYFEKPPATGEGWDHAEEMNEWQSQWDTDEFRLFNEAIKQARVEECARVLAEARKRVNALYTRNLTIGVVVDIDDVRGALFGDEPDKIR